MTVETADLAEFRFLVRRMEQLLAAPDAQAATNPDGSPAHVAAGELIESAWGNAVVDSLPYARIGFATDSGTLSQTGLLIQTRTNVYTSDYYGDFTIPFPTAFTAGNVTVLAVNAEPSAPRYYSVGSVTSTSAAINALLGDGTPARDSSCAVAWYAIGHKP